MTLVSGNGDWGDQTGSKNETQFGHISAMAFDSSGNLFVSDQSHHKIKKLTFDPSTGAATSTDFAGSGSYSFENANGTSASFKHPMGIAIDSNEALVPFAFSNE